MLNILNTKDYKAEAKKKESPSSRMRESIGSELHYSSISSVGRRTEQRKRELQAADQGNNTLITVYRSI